MVMKEMMMIVEHVGSYVKMISLEKTPLYKYTFWPITSI